MGENFADGLAPVEALEQAIDGALAAADGPLGGHLAEGASFAATMTLTGDIAADAADYAAQAESGMVRDERADQGRLVRCLAGNPFRPVEFDPAWLTPDVLYVAEGAYAGCCPAFGGLIEDELAVLADALEDAGCSDARVLRHLREDDTHAKGCWVVDACLGKS